MTQNFVLSLYLDSVIAANVLWLSERNAGHLFSMKFDGLKKYFNFFLVHSVRIKPGLHITVRNRMGGDDCLRSITGSLKIDMEA